MTISTGSGFATQAASVVFGTVGFVELDFSGGVQRLTSWPVDVTALGYTWSGLGDLASMTEIPESEDGAPRRITLSLTAVKQAMVALALGAVDTYQGRSAKVWIAAFNSAGVLQGDPVLRFVGAMDRIRIQPGDETRPAAILLDCESATWDTRRNPTALRMNHAQHQFEHPGELLFQRVDELITKPQMWLSKRFQEI